MTTVNIGTRYVQFAEGGARTWDTGGGGDPPPATTYTVIVTGGESNGDGESEVSLLPTALQQAFPRVQLLINPGDTTFPGSAGTFVPIHLGVNNALGHEGQSPAVHGMEAGLIDYQIANPTHPNVYLIQTAQGGSYLNSWGVGSAYRSLASARIQAAKTNLAALGITSINWLFYYSHGINDAIGPGGMTPANLRLAMADLIGFYRTEIGVGTAARVLMPQWPSPRRDLSPEFLNDVEVLLPASVTNMALLQAADLPVRDQNHFSGDGYRTLGGVRVPVHF